eukprot:GHVP01041882.1.p1 GENE.GHVP01041882.1~~GHVP01041882.1.p1  ORF type:complete len:161 (-),score=29.62 GHVP01041882.1:590-1072(-)
MKFIEFTLFLVFKYSGNSAYATSGINAARFEPGMSFDPIISFVDDTLIGGMNMNDKSLVSTMARKSAAAIDFIEKNSELKFDEIVRLGGHSHPRTYRVAKLGSSKPLGKIIVEAFVKTLQECPGAEILGFEIKIGRLESTMLQLNLITQRLLGDAIVLKG